MPRSAPEVSAEGRRVSKPLGIRFALVLAVIAGLKAKFMDLIQPVEQPIVLNRSMLYDPYTEMTPPADIDVEMLRYCAYQTLDRFFQKHGEISDTNFFEFFVTYRESMEQLQENGWRGPCNNVVETGAECCASQGHPYYVVSIYPKNFFRRFTTGWHQMGTVCIEKDADYLIFDNTKILRWKGTLDEYIAQRHRSYTIVAYGGVRRWFRTQENFFARMTIHAGPNEDPMPTQVPIDVPQTMYATSVP